MILKNFNKKAPGNSNPDWKPEQGVSGKIQKHFAGLIGEKLGEKGGFLQCVM